MVANLIDRSCRPSVLGVKVDSRISTKLLTISALREELERTFTTSRL